MFSFVYTSLRDTIFYFNMWYYLNAPYYCGGEEGLPTRDICAKLMGVNSQLLLSKEDELICQDKMNHVVVGRTTVCITILFTYFASRVMPVWYAAGLKYMGRGKRLQAAAKRKKPKQVKIKHLRS